MPSITKANDFEIYRIRGGHQDWEWATIAICAWTRPGNDGKPREGGDILIHSSYGSWAYQWGHLGLPFKQWLAKTTDADYLCTKFLGTKADVFSGELTVQALREDLLKMRREGSFGKKSAREIWDWIEDHEATLMSSGHDFVECMNGGLIDCHMHVPGTHTDFFDDPWERFRTTMDHGFAGFWRELWPIFQTQLRTELS